MTEIGWVADQVNNGVPVGEMLCPTNPSQASEAYVDLLAMELSNVSTCVNMLGSRGETAPDGQRIVNPCRQIIESDLAPSSDARRQLVETEVYLKNYNTNYTASWYFVRSEPLLNGSGNLVGAVPACGVSLQSRNSTRGPLKLAMVQTSGVSSSSVPLLGDGMPAGPLPQQIGSIAAGEPTVKSLTQGPVRNPSMDVPAFPAATPREGPGGWWSTWVRDAAGLPGVCPVAQVHLQHPVCRRQCACLCRCQPRWSAQ